MAVGTSRATGEGKEGQQDEIHLPGLRAERMVKGKRWLLLTRWINLSSGKRQELNSLFELNRKLFKAYYAKAADRTPLCTQPLCTPATSVPCP